MSDPCLDCEDEKYCYYPCKDKIKHILKEENRSKK